MDYIVVIVKLATLQAFGHVNAIVTFDRRNLNHATAAAYRSLPGREEGE